MPDRHIPEGELSPSELPPVGAGGNAFPMAGPGMTDLPGMSILDYFAGQALQGILANATLKASAAKANVLAAKSYTAAEAMLAERDRRNKPEPGELR